MTDSFETVVTAIEDSWSADTAYSADEWSSDNPARGQCVVSALIVQDYFGGELKKYKTIVNGVSESHYTNVLPDRDEVDVSRSQYPDDQELVVSVINLHGSSGIREKLLSEANTKERYESLKSRVEHRLKNSR